jgi:hypothetical protein
MPLSHLRERRAIEQKNKRKLQGTTPEEERRRKKKFRTFWFDSAPMSYG